ncbi:hypothetical protein OF83DRAFT_1060203 [Amylostereum chailletii]|nr:hypothetical protein OF83DRAFT_1060203 [Amylostereum chailletii]
MSTPLPFVVYNAFTDQLGGGNPAAILFAPSPSPSSELTPTAEDRQTIARNFSLPVCAFVTPKDPQARTNARDAATTRTFGIQYFTVATEYPICGHGTLAAAHALFADRARVPEGVRCLRFEAAAGHVLVARTAAHGGRVELALQCAVLDEVRADGEVGSRLRAALARALGPGVGVKYMARGGGGGGFEKYVLVEVEAADLGALELDSGFVTHVLTAPSSLPEVAFESRMFAPAVGVPEDPVCGSAHCLLAPYWFEKAGLAGRVRAKQASARGGELGVELDRERGLVLLTGAARKVSEGTVFV